MKELEKILRADPPWWHVRYSASSSSSLASDQAKTIVPASSILSFSPAVTKLTDMYLSPSISAHDALAIEAAWADFVHGTLEKADGFVCAGQGWVMEERECKQVEGGKAKVFHTSVSWESEEKCQAFSDAAFSEKVQAYVKYVESCLVIFRPQ